MSVLDVAEAFLTTAVLPGRLDVAEVTLTITGDLEGTVPVWDGTAWVQALPHVWDGTEWVPVTPHVWDGQAWVQAT